MNEIFKDAPLSLPNQHVDEMVANKASYNADAVMANQSFTVPWMTSNGTFIVNGVERVPLIQEVKARNVIYVSSMVDDKGLSVTASTRFPDAKFPVRLVLRATEIYLDVSAISRQLEEQEDDDDDTPTKAPTKTPLSVLVDMFGSRVDLMDTLDDTELGDDIIINTLLYMFSKCVSVYFGKEPSDRDNYANKWLRTSGDIIGPIVAEVTSRKSTNFAKALDTKLMSMMRTDWRKIRKCKSWKELVKNKLVEYLDPSETNAIEDEIADLGYGGDFTKFKYMEIHPCTLFGIPASLIPFANHNQSARNIFASSMMKQAMQLVAYPPLYHEGKYLVYGQRPLVDTMTADMLGLNTSPNGINLVVCVLAYTGYNMEDAIIVNKTSVDNGLFQSLVRNVYNRTTDGDVIYDEDEMLLLEGDDDKRLFVKDDEYRELSIGDKIASRHAQKGVVGKIMNASDMPFTGDGIVPDIIFNPHGIPSRMTMGQLLEGVVGTQCTIDGSFFDGTSFNQDLDIDAILDMEQRNSTTLYSGMSGEDMGEHHLGTIYYMPLKHQSKDKVYKDVRRLKKLQAVENEMESLREAMESLMKEVKELTRLKAEMKGYVIAEKVKTNMRIKNK
ncbi:hypothetical protein KVV02_001827 [Mortierella alpina]|uniref:DNA-directed RNA polymerase n=1 Tax=Mortierella alpina TaxID=64518 RepID=A0A9P8A279_MORAP|nr:hypothetical protein KVV02_001827 [Mortierella alpina]